MTRHSLTRSDEVRVGDGLDLVDVELVQPPVHDLVEVVEERHRLQGGAAATDDLEPHMRKGHDNTILILYPTPKPQV